MYRDPWALFRLDEDDVVVTAGDIGKGADAYDVEARINASFVVDVVDDEVVAVIIDVVVVASDDEAPPPLVKCKLFIVAAVYKYYKIFCIFNCRKAPLGCEAVAIYFVMNLILYFFDIYKICVGCVQNNNVTNKQWTWAWEWKVKWFDEFYLFFD